jgi:hypothetical protein
MIEAKDAIVSTDDRTHKVCVRKADAAQPYPLCPIGAVYEEWRQASDQQRVQLMLETAIDLATQGFDMVDILRAFAEVRQFRALGSDSYPMCRALTTALVGQCLEPNTETFEALMRA